MPPGILRNSLPAANSRSFEPSLRALSRRPIGLFCDPGSRSAPSRTRSDEVRIGEIAVVALPALAVGEGAAVERAGFSACRPQHGVAGGGVPFHGAAEAGVDIGKALGNEAEFQRRADRGAGVDAVIVEEARGLRRIVRATGDSGQCCAAAAAADILSAGDGVVICRGEAFGAVVDGDEAGREGGCIDDAGNRYAVPDKGDVDGELVAAGDEFLCAVEWIDKEEQAAGNVGYPTGGDSLLGNDGNLGEMFGERLENQAFGFLVRLCDR